MRTLDLRTLNRTLLSRQFLLERTTMPVLDVVGRLVALQAQEPNWAYVGLWTRAESFRHEQLTALFHDRSVVRGTMVRRTQHVAAAADFSWLRPTVQPIVGSALTHAYYADETSGLDLKELTAVARESMARQAHTRSSLGRVLAERFPGRHGVRMANAVELLEGVVHPPPNGVWGAWGNRRQTPVALAQDWTGIPMADGPRPDTMILRYLESFGPASVPDVQAWSGLTRLREVVDTLRPRLRVFRTEEGRELFDLPDAPVADPGMPAPVRFLPAFDNAALGHKDRTRIIGDADRRRISPTASLGVPLFLVDGFVHGCWKLAGGELRIEPFRPLSDAQGEAVLGEARLLLDFVGPAAATDAVIR
ncbi:winged helix DNA-binding domain-containing protein [Streptomyces candidus]|uniref:Winged helix DNA-binding domain-containing protein n=1 Tax=Streptomyces candidus TaxID=67283 RepID=A0A7X0LPM9_9ACTN|nr:winged helix DNA-binding domain-containing protein [Streptomyces candidus]MBB6436693.1 hypothetical protein [Streptomyces candidus]GHH51092.1 hypothetical protein GCM10018773_49060 [Streptomyces candidus]